MDFSPPPRQDIEQFLCDVRLYFKASLETSEYENTSNLFHHTEAGTTLKLLQRCEELLQKYTVPEEEEGSVASQGRARRQTCDSGHSEAAAAPATSVAPTVASFMAATAATSTGTESSSAVAVRNEQLEDDSYLDMTVSNKPKLNSKEYLALNTSTASDKTFRCSTQMGMSVGGVLQCHSDPHGRDMHNDISDDDDNEESGCTYDPQIYDICQVSQVDIDDTQTELDCPYSELPAGHLAIQKSSKYGQLQRIEKRLFFDQSKKCYCGILSDWLLCYDGPTASQPVIMVHLKSRDVEIEHSGEGKRRDVCFQVTTADPNRKFVFQAINEVDAKEWIHAIEAAIRGDTAATMMRNARKLPTPPVMKKLTFIGSKERSSCSASSAATGTAGDYIYEEPSPLYQLPEPTELLITTTTSHDTTERSDLGLPDQASDHLAIAKKYEYDIPKCPPQPLKTQESTQTEAETAGLLNISETEDLLGGGINQHSLPLTKSKTHSTEKIDFQTKVKDLHSKLSSQLSAAGPNMKKSVKKTYSCSSSESESIILTPSPPTAKEQKKQKKSNSTPTGSPQKNCNHNNNNNNNSGINSSGSGSGSEKSAKNWFLNRLNKSTSSTRSSASLIASPSKCKQSEKENLLNALDASDPYDGVDQQHLQQCNGGSSPVSPIIKSNGSKSKVNMIISQFEANGHLATMFSMEALAGNAVATFNSFCDSDCNNYEPIMTVATPPSSFMKKV